MYFQIFVCITTGILGLVSIMLQVVNTPAEERINEGFFWLMLKIIATGLLFTLAVLFTVSNLKHELWVSQPHIL